MTKFNNLRVKRVKSNLVYTESKLVKKDHGKKKKYLKRQLSYRCHAKRHNAKSQHAKRNHAKRNHAKSQHANRHNAKRQHAKRHDAKRQHGKRHPIKVNLLKRASRELLSLR